MKPVAIFRHTPTEGPGYFATYLEQRGIPWKLIKIDAGESVPENASEYCGLAFMGGPMSVNDALPWIPPALELIRAAVRLDVPVLGHCLGGQLMAKALGGIVTRNPCKEIGWGMVEVVDTPVARSWFGHVSPAFMSFHWHGETFSVPPGAQRVLFNRYCENQAFALGKHLGMQCHVEMTSDMVDSWCVSGEREIQRSNSPAVQAVATIKSDLDLNLAALHRVADGIYAHWIAGLAL